MITSTSNSQVKNVVSLQSKAKLRREKQEFVVEGIKMVMEAPSDRIVKIYASCSFENSNPNVVDILKTKGEYEAVADNVFVQMSDTKTPQGILAVVKMLKYSVDDLIADNALIIATENLQDPGNMGTIIRTAEGAGATGILVSGNSVDLYNPKTIRSTMGSLFRMKVAVESDFLDALAYLKEKGVVLHAAHLDGKNDYTEENYTKKCGFVIGNESNGLTDEAAKMCDILVKIPMAGKLESLNASVAAAILMYEANRQRR